MPNLHNKRNSTRGYDLKPTAITLKDQRFRINNISNHGIGIILEEDGPRFFIGERINKIPIPLKSGSVNLKGTISHISISATGTVCGINFMFSGDEFNTIIQFKKERTQYPG